MDAPLLPCPCCRFPTLEERGTFDICVICWWEDDGQDDPFADETWCGPNKDISLAKARRNFADHLHMYDPGTGIDVVEYPGQNRLALLAYVREVLDGREPLDTARLDALLALPQNPHRHLPG